MLDMVDQSYAMFLAIQNEVGNNQQAEKDENF